MPDDAKAVSRRLPPQFHTLVGIGVLAIILLGFAKTYYLKFAFGTPALPALVHLHGLVMSTWFLLFVIQARLVASHRIDLHRRLGMFGGLVALSVLVVGALTAIHAARLGHTPGPPALQFLVVPFGDLFVFATLVGLGLAYRAKGDVHKRFMLLSCVGTITAAVGRIPIEAFHRLGILGFFGFTDLLLIGCIAYDWSRTRRLHPVFLWGGLFIILSHPLRLMLSGTGLWMSFATWVTR
ncbi:MAG TPA: hypothetical protein VJ483_00355 [Holophagaceae bacterium]|nr:hypothetical protein [Holophagaceae bacterium]